MTVKKLLPITSRANSSDTFVGEDLDRSMDEMIMAFPLTPKSLRGFRSGLKNWTLNMTFGSYGVRVEKEATFRQFAGVWNGNYGLDNSS